MTNNVLPETSEDIDRVKRREHLLGVMTEPTTGDNFAGGREDSKSRDNPTRFRFKEKSEPSRTNNDRSRSPSKRRHRHHHSFHHRNRRRTVSPSAVDDPTAYDDSIHGLPPEVAFRESLFDALGDDEGAAFWQGVYGQPIHKYPDTYQNEKTGEMERMNDEEYAHFVRRKMWEKSWEGIEAAKEEKRREREEHKTRDDENSRKHKRQRIEEPFVFDYEVEQSLKRGEQRKEKRHWKSLWVDYSQRWNNLQSIARDRMESKVESEQLFLSNEIAWPVESGKRKDVNTAEIERFVSKGAQHSEGNNDAQDALLEILKAERIRWHPDKMQQRFGFMNIDEATMKGVTAVFQVFDQMWNETRGRQ